MHRYNYAHLISLDVEHHTVIRQKAGLDIRRLNLGGRFPRSAAGVRVPSPQWQFGPWVFVPKIAERRNGNDAHSLFYNDPIMGAIEPHYGCERSPRQVLK